MTYPIELARPRLGRSGESSGTSERTGPSDSPEADPALSILLSSSIQAYASRLSATSNLVCGPAARRKWTRILRYER